MDRSRIAVIIPAFNEEKTIFNVVKTVNKFGKSIVIDDGSIDKTSSEAQKSRAILVVHKKNLGYDAALNSGFKQALKLKFNYIITIDADGQHNPKLLKKFINLLDEGNLVVLGVRSKKARLAEHIFGLYTKYRYNIEDPLCGLKAYNFQNNKLFKLSYTYESIGTELMLNSISSGIKHKQVYFKVKERIDKPRLGGSILVNFKILLSLFYWLVRK